VRVINADKVQLPISVPLVLGDYQTGYIDAVDDCRKAINNTPTIKTNDGWISVSDEVPRVDETATVIAELLNVTIKPVSDTVIVATSDGDVLPALYVVPEHQKAYWKSLNNFPIDDVAYWTPMPERPKNGE